MGTNERFARGSEVVTLESGMPYPILSNEFQSSDALHGDFDEAGQPRQEGEAGARGIEGGGRKREEG